MFIASGPSNQRSLGAVCFFYLEQTRQLKNITMGGGKNFFIGKFYEEGGQVV